MNMINRLSSETIYSQIANSIAIHIQELFEPGDLYLSEKDLTDKFGVNRHTVRRAVEELVKRGFLEKRHGFGTFVAEKKVAYRVKNCQRFTQAAQADNLTIETTLVQKEIIVASGSLATKMQLKNGEEVFFIETLRKIEAQTVALISHFIPTNIGCKALQHYESGSLGDFLKEHCHIQTKKTSSLVSCVMPNAEDSFKLKMTSAQPILKVKTINTHITTKKIIEYSITRFRSDMVHLEILMNS